MANYYKSTLASGGGAIGDADVADVLAGKTFSSSNGNGLTGTMANRGSVGTQTLTPSTTSYTIPQGYHNGNGKVQISTQEKSVTATTSAQNVTPDSGKVLSKVTVNPQNHTATYTPTSRASALDMGANNNNRYVNTNSVPNTNSGTYTFASGDTGDTKDLGATNTYRYVNAANVYNKGKADGTQLVLLSSPQKAASSIGTTSINGLSNYSYIVIQGYINVSGMKHTFMECIQRTNTTYALAIPYIDSNEVVQGFRSSNITISGNNITFSGGTVPADITVTRIYGTNDSQFLPHA